MNFSGYFLLAAAVVVSVVFAQQSAQQESDTINFIQNSFKNLYACDFDNVINIVKEDYINGTRLVAESEKTITDAIKAAIQIIFENPNEALKNVQQAFEKAQEQLYHSGVPFFKAIQKAITLLNERAKSRLSSASQCIQNGGPAALDQMNVAQNLLNQEVVNGDKATSQGFLESILIVIRSGFADTFNNIQESIKNVDQAIRDAQSSRPIREQVENLNSNCEAVKNDSEASHAVEAINIAADDALKAGVSAELVEKFKKTVVCALGDFVKVTAGIKRTLKNIRQNIVSKPVEGKQVISAEIINATKNTQTLVAKILLVLGDVGLVSENQNSLIDEAIAIIQLGTVQFLSSNKFLIDLIGNGYGGDSPLIAVDAALDIAFNGAAAFYDANVKFTYAVVGRL